MNYELAKQLNDARYKLKLCHHWNGLSVVDIEGVKYFIPTLSELIEACVGHGFNHLSWVREEGELDDNGKIMMWETQDLDGNSYSGHTPEEAVAKLWLELNK